MTQGYVTVRDPSDAVFARPEAEVHADFKKVMHQVMREGTTYLLNDFYEKVLASGDIGEIRKAIQMGIAVTGAEAAKAVDPYSGLATINITVNHGTVHVGASTPAQETVVDVTDLPFTDTPRSEVKVRSTVPWNAARPSATMLRNYMVNADVVELDLEDALATFELG